MNIAEAIKRVELIRHAAIVKEDFESAHSQEDDLRADFIKWIAECDGRESLLYESDSIAKEILKTDAIEFPRWCA